MDPVAYAYIMALGAVGFSISFICETLVLWRTRWSRFLPAAAISFMMNLVTFFTGICIAFIIASSDPTPNIAGFLIPLGFAFTAFDSLTMLFIVRWRKWSHAPSTTVGVAIKANAAAMIVMFLLAALGD